MVYQVKGELHCRECFGGYIKSEGEQELEDDYSYFCSRFKTCTLWQ